VLEEAHKRRPSDREVLYALINFNRENGNVKEARQYAEKLLEITPHDPDALRLLDELKSNVNR
jgi:Flp pilus assembly protein TadD